MLESKERQVVEAVLAAESAAAGSGLLPISEAAVEEDSATAMEGREGQDKRVELTSECVVEPTRATTDRARCHAYC